MRDAEPLQGFSLSEATRRQLTEHGFVPFDDTAASRECERVAREHMAGCEATVEEVLHVLEEHRPSRVQTHVGSSRESQHVGWIDPGIIRAEVWRYTSEQVAQYAVAHRHDADRMIHDCAGDLHVLLEPTPWPGRFIASITTNGNHRATVYRSLSLPLIPAQITAPGAWGAGRWLHPLVNDLAEHGLVDVLEQSSEYVTFRSPDGAAPWVFPPPTATYGLSSYRRADRGRATPERVSDRIKQVERRLGQGEPFPAAYDYLREPSPRPEPTKPQETPRPRPWWRRWR